MRHYTFTQTHFFFRNLRLWAGTVVLVLAFGLMGYAQDDQNEIMPARGFHPNHSYSLGDIETISTTSGNLIVDIPLASLPPGRGGHPGFELRLRYNSKVWDGEADVAENPEHAGQFVDVVWLKKSQEGGWRYNVPKNFNWHLDNRNDHGIVYPINDPRRTHIWKLKMMFPDGSSREMRPYGFDDGWDDGYFAVQPAAGMSYFSTDGSFLRLDIGASNTWTLNFPDGTQIKRVAPGVWRTTDRHGSYIEAQSVTDYNGTGHSADIIADQFGRSMVIEYGTNEDYIHATGVNNASILTTVRWGTTNVKKEYRAGNHFQYDANLNGSLKVVTEIELPTQIGTGLKYLFGYNGCPTTCATTSVGWGEMSSLTLPSGANATYQYNMDNKSGFVWQANMVLANWPTRKHLNYTLEYDGDTTAAPTQTWQYNIGSGGARIVGPDGGVTQETFGPNPGMGRVFKTVHPDGSIVERIWKQNRPFSPGGVTLPANYVINPFVEAELLSIPDASGTLILTSIKQYSFDKNGNLTQLKEYDWVAYSSIPRDSLGNPTGVPGSAPLKRVTTNSYHCQTPGALDTTTYDPETYDEATAPRLLTAPKSNEVGNGAQTLSRIEFTYDAPLATANLTEQRAWDSTKGPINATEPLLDDDNSIATSMQYNPYGDPILVIDARQVQTQYIYGTVGTISDLYPTEIKTAFGTAVQRWEKREYDFHTAVVTKVTDWDNQVSTTTQHDDLGRPILVHVAADRPEETQTSTQYLAAERRVVIRNDLETTGDGKLVTIQHYDQLGRVRLTRNLEEFSAPALADETVGIKVQTRYVIINPCQPSNTPQCLIDNSGVIGTYKLISNPYRAATSDDADAESTMGWTRSRKNNAGRTVEVQTFAGGGLPTPWGTNAASSGTVTTFYDGRFTTVTDQAGKVRRNKIDGLGRLVRVDEPSDASNTLGGQDSPTQATSYGYDALGNLATVSQGAQTRSFQYTSLGRLRSTITPETGTIDFEYDGNGNLTKRIDSRMVPGTSTRRSITNAYDALGRITSRVYNDGTPNITYDYDDADVDFSRGRVTKITSGISSYSYDELDPFGRVKEGTQTTDGQPYVMTYQYNVSGAMTSQTYPSGRIVKTNYDSAGRIAGVKNEASGLYYAGAPSTETANRFQYSAAGAIQVMKLGNDLWEHTNFNSRLQPTQIGLGNSSTDSSQLRLDYAYGVLVSGVLDSTKNNGNLQGQAIVLPGRTLNQKYTYDELNRLKSAEEMDGSTPVWTQIFTYDAYGNRRFGTGTSLPDITQNQTVTNPNISGTDNRISDPAYRYDSAGNLECDPEHPCGSTSPFPAFYEYDGENRMVTAGAGATYVYDAGGRRVKKVVSGAEGGTTVFVYNIIGQLVAEYSDSEPSGTNGTSYVTADYLGTPRLITKSDKTPRGRHDYQPFGEDIPDSFGGRSGVTGYTLNDGMRQQYTGKEHDPETKLDYFIARYYRSTHGRFTSADPVYFQAMMALDPQRFNLYVYGRNNPLKFIDPDGERVHLRGDLTWLLNNVLYAMVGGKEDFDKYFDIKDGEVVLRDGVDISGGNAGVQQLAELVQAKENYLYFAGTDGAAAADLFTGARDKKDKDKLSNSGKIAAGEFTCGGNRLTGCGYILGTTGREGTQQPANLANGDPVFAVIAYNTNVVMTQTGLGSVNPANLTLFVTQFGCTAPECSTQRSGLGQVVKPVSFFIHESTENQAFAAQGKGFMNYPKAHDHAIHREAFLRKELGITGGFAGGSLDTRIPKK